MRIFDEAKAREFYLDFLDFAVTFEHRFGENFPLYVGVSRDGCELHLSEHHGDSCPGSAVRIQVQDIDELQRRLNAKDYRHAKPGCETTQWNTKKMQITDPFGNRLNFFEPLSK